MPVKKSLNKVLKKMWVLDEKSKNEKLQKKEREFYNKNLRIIVKYYRENNKYWQKKRLTKL